jgi:DNA-binding MarR family transcriptional regulator
MPTPRRETEDLADAFFTVAHGLKRAVNARFQPTGLSLARLRVLFQLIVNGPCRMGELSHCVDVAPRTMTSTVDAMERDGLVQRQPDPDDGRATIVMATDAGVTSFEEGRRLQARAVADLFDVLDASQQAELRDVLARLEAAAADAAPVPATRKSAAQPAPAS